MPRSYVDSECKEDVPSVGRYMAFNMNIFEGATQCDTKEKNGNFIRVVLISATVLLVHLCVGPKIGMHMNSNIDKFLAEFIAFT